MSGAQTRDAVLFAIRSALGAGGGDRVRSSAVQRRIAEHRPGTIPERAKFGRKERLDLFTRMLEGQSARVSRAATVDEIPGLVSAYLREHNLPAEFRTGSDELLQSVPWDKAPALTRHSGRARGSDTAAISRARAAAAETGTLFLTSGADNPTTLNFLPETHIAVIRAGDILGSYEDAWNALRKAYGPRALPRTVNLVSGPSRTADIEQIIVMGAHGPRRLHVIIVG